MLLFKYFEKGAKDGLPDPNGPLSSRTYILGRGHWATDERYPGGSWSNYKSAESAASDGRKSGPYNT